MGVDDFITCEACFFMAQIYLARHEFDESLEYCQRARIGQRRLVGIQGLTYQRSTRLLTLVFETRGDHISAAAYHRLMPAEAWNDNSDIAVLPFTSRGFGISAQVQAEAEEFLASNTFGRKSSTEPDPRGAQLRTATEKGDINVVRLLIYRGVNIDFADEEDVTAVQLACCKGHYAIAELLIQNGADINRSSTHGATPLYWGIKEGRRDIVTLLLEHGAEIDSPDPKQLITALMFAAAYGHSTILQDLLNRGAKIEAKCDRYSFEYGKTALGFAAARGHPDVVAMLVEAGADVNARGDDLRTPLIHAAERTYNDRVLRLLLQAGADTSAVGDNKRSALDMAKEKEMLSAVTLLMEHENHACM